MKDNKKYIKESELFDDRIITEGEDEEVSNADNLESEVTDEMIRIDSLKLANKVCRMIDSVSIEDMINVASMAEHFLRDYVPGCDIEEILGLKSSSKEDESEKEENQSDDEESTEGSDDEDINIDDLDDFTIEDDEEDNKEEKDEEDKDDNTNEISSEVPDQFII